MKLLSRVTIFALFLGLFLGASARSQSSAAAYPAPAPPLFDLVPIQSIEPSIQIDLKYKTADNITGKPIYPPQFQALLRRGVAIDLQNVQLALRKFGYGLKVWDAWRPLYAQKALYAAIPDTRYVADPGLHPLHNRGVAVDVTLYDLATNKELPMPTAFDVMDPSADFFYKGGDYQILRRVQILQKTMLENRFYATRTEWWHFVSTQWKQFSNIDMIPDTAASAVNPYASGSVDSTKVRAIPNGPK